MTHTHSYRKTGKAFYVCPISYEIKCECGDIAYLQGEGITVLTKEEAMRARPELYGLPKDFTEEQLKALLQSPVP